MGDILIFLDNQIYRLRLFHFVRTGLVPEQTSKREEAEERCRTPTVESLFSANKAGG